MKATRILSSITSPNYSNATVELENGELVNVSLRILPDGRLVIEASKIDKNWEETDGIPLSLPSDDKGMTCEVEFDKERHATAYNTANGQN